MNTDFGWRWLDRIAYRSAFRHTKTTFDAQLHARSAGTGGSLVLLVSSWALYALIIALFLAGVWLCSLSFPGPGLLLGLIVIGVAVELRPRFGRVPKYATEVTPAEAPELHALVAQVASAVGAQPPAIYVEEDVFNASADSYGLRRRRVLVLGLPLWNALSRQQRVALLGHELGHFVNGDPRRGLVVQPAFTALHRLSILLRPAGDHGLWARLILGALTAVLRAVLLLPRLALQILAFRDGQRAEYRADRLAATAAGRAATVELLDLLTVLDSVAMLVKRDARAGRPVTAWPATTAGLLTEIRPQLTARREAELRDQLSLFDSHPPNGLRAQLVQAQANESAAVVLNEAANARIDQELAKHSARSARALKSL
ncbi:M48 family metallopeptidase [Dactylosporangium sp. CA-092794]|uniref:M48 family metallopeptidase n=1 Tax=Dactylosporangium sp. CA-092794 TaxID=3239929 RepID=UPI003D908CB9